MSDYRRELLIKSYQMKEQEWIARTPETPDAVGFGKTWAAAMHDLIDILEDRQLEPEDEHEKEI